MCKNNTQLSFKINGLKRFTESIARVSKLLNFSPLLPEAQLIIFVHICGGLLRFKSDHLLTDLVKHFQQFCSIK